MIKKNTEFDKTAQTKCHIPETENQRIKTRQNLRILRSTKDGST